MLCAVSSILASRLVANDTTVRVNNLSLQLEKSRFRDHFAEYRVDVFEPLDGTYAVVWKKRVIRRYDAQEPAPRPPGFIACWSREEVKNGKGEAFRLPFFSGRLPELGSLPSVALSSGETSPG